MDEQKGQLIYGKISEVMGYVDAIAKGRSNKEQGYSFRGIDDMYNALHNHLATAKIFFTSQILSKDREDRPTKDGKGVRITTLINVRWSVFAEDGSFVTTDTLGEAMDSGDKSANKAMSASYKYALMQIFCIPTEDAKDTEEEDHEVGVGKTSPERPASVPAQGAAVDKPVVPRPATVENDGFKTCANCQMPFTPDAKFPKTATCSWKCAEAVREMRKAEAEARRKESLVTPAKFVDGLSQPPAFLDAEAKK